MKDNTTDYFQEILAHTQEASDLLKLISNPQRLLILCLLNEQELSVGVLNEYLSDLSQSALSQHLAQLRAAKLVQTRREAQTIYYSMSDSRVKSIIKLLHSLYC